MTDETNPRVQIGGNNPPLWAVLRSFAAEENFSQTVTDYLNEEYKPFDEPFERLLAEAREIAALKVLPDKETRDKVPPLMKRIRDLAAKFDAFHTKEKEPYLRGGQAVDQKFYGKIDKLARRANEQAGRLRLPAIDAHRLRQRGARRRAGPARAGCGRGAPQGAGGGRRSGGGGARCRRGPPRCGARAQAGDVEAKTVVAQTAAEEAIGAKADASVAMGRAEDAHIATLAKPADIMRERLDDGTMSTMGQETYAELLDKDLVDKAALWPYIGVKDREGAPRVGEVDRLPEGNARREGRPEEQVEGAVMAEIPVFPGDPARPGAPLPSLRDYFAAQAIAGFCHAVGLNDEEFGSLLPDAVRRAYAVADAMLKERTR
jgi:hypothetical protein